MHLDFGYVRVAAAVSRAAVADVAANVVSMLPLAERAAEAGCDLVVFPELCLTAYTCADLFQQSVLVDAAEAGLVEFAARTAGLPTVFVVGMPVRVDSRLYNCGVAVSAGKVLGVVPKSVLPSYKEFYEKRWFVSGVGVESSELVLAGQVVPFGTDLLFQAGNAPDFTIGIEICEDLWSPLPPSVRQALAGATILVNLSASDDLVGKADYRRQWVTQQSGRCLAAYVYSGAGVHESTTDLVFAGHCLVAENATMLKEGERFQRDPFLMMADVDVSFLQHERGQNTAFLDAAVQQGRESGDGFRRHCFTARLDSAPPAELLRPLRSLPFVPGDPGARHDVCQEIFAIQSTGLAGRMAHTGINDLVIGLSGGLDSTLAVLVAVEACNRLGIPHTHIHGITMPGFGTSERTLRNVEALCRKLAVALETIGIRESTQGHLSDIGHDGKSLDIAYENAQARERSQVLMDKANLLGALVVGTGDLSELALGWCTYNGDHMSMYAVNTGVPKTLVTFLVDFVADQWADHDLHSTLKDILATPISPELLPADGAGDIAQKTEEVIGPYALHDFFLYHIVRAGSSPRKTLHLAGLAFGDAYDTKTILKWLKVFVRRFFSNQFKRSCLPDGPKVGTLALSPRGDWRMPSDARPALWLADLDEVGG